MLLVSAAPLVTFFVPLVIAKIFGCGLDEAASQQCIVLGINLAATLTTLSLSTILVLPTLVLAPFGLLLLVANAVAGRFHRD